MSDRHPEIKGMNLTRLGIGLLIVSVITLGVPSTPLGNEKDIWKMIVFYLFIITSLSTPWVFAKANRFQPTRISRAGFWLSWIPFALCLLLFLGLLATSRQ